MKIKLTKLSDQVIVITGACSGIGLATARMAAQRGARLVLAARSDGALNQLKLALSQRGYKAIVVTADVCRADDVAAIAQRAQQEFGGFDTWVNNAGIGMYGKAEETHIGDMRKLFETNFWGLVYGSLEAVKHFRGRYGGAGKALINIGSTESDRALPLQGLYAASKHAVKGFTDSLRMELEEDGQAISVTLIKPGAIDTPFPNNAKNYLDSVPQHLPPMYAPETVAQAILHCTETPVRELFVGAGGKANAAMGEWAPRLADKLGESVFVPGTQSDQPARRRDALECPSENLRERGESSGRVAKTSLYTQATLHPVIAGAAILGVAWAVSALRRGSSERVKQTHHDGNHLSLAEQVSSKSEWRYAESEQPLFEDTKSAPKFDRSQLREHMKVRGSDGETIGKVDRVEGAWIKLTKESADEIGQHHYIEINEVRSVEGDIVRLKQTADQAKRQWHGEPPA